MPVSRNVTQGVGVLSRTIEEWDPIPIEFFLWKYSRDEDEELLRSVLAEIDAGASHEDIVEQYTNREGELVESYRIHPSVHIVSRRCAGTAAWDLILQVLGITANVMGVAAGTFAAAKFVATAWKRAREAAARRDYDRINVGTPAAAALLAADWLNEHEPQTARDLIACGDAQLYATNHGSYYVVTITSSLGERLFIVVGETGQVTPIPTPPAAP